jgi:hypothetical protein
MNLDESQPHDHERTVEIVYYSGLSAVAATTAEDPDPFLSLCNQKGDHQQTKYWIHLPRAHQDLKGGLLRVP